MGGMCRADAANRRYFRKGRTVLLASSALCLAQATELGILSSAHTGALRRRVLLSGTMLVAAAVGYGRRAYAACVNTGGSTYQCSGTNATTQAINGPNANNAAVSTLPGFSVNTATGDGITITGDGALSYTDTNASSLTATGGYALYVGSSGDVAGTPGSVTINTNGALSGVNNGIFARNYGTGAVTVTANGNVTGTVGFGIYAANNSAGTNLSRDHRRRHDGQRRRHRHLCVQPRHGRADHHRQRRCHRHQWSAASSRGTPAPAPISP